MPWTAPGADLLRDPALTRAYEGCLPGGRFSGPLLAFDSVTSTQTVARRLAAAGAPEGTVVLADGQSTGRGRRGRRWIAPPGKALLVSCVLRPPLPPPRWPELTIAAGCAVAEGIETVTLARPRLKWPNDVLLAGRKVGGILAEGDLAASPSVVLGIGVNVNQAPDDWPPGLATVAASLASLGFAVRRETLLAAILARLAARYDDLIARGFEPIRTAWRGRALLGGRVRTPSGEGVAVDLASGGALVVRRDDGATVTIVADTEPGAPVPARAGD
jgi:BirA family biotin operon repressor/biotin-[acetyl-CoA-carboxylase] ligase